VRYATVTERSFVVYFAYLFGRHRPRGRHRCGRWADRRMGQTGAGEKSPASCMSLTGPVTKGSVWRVRLWTLSTRFGGAKPPNRADFVAATSGVSIAWELR